MEERYFVAISREGGMLGLMTAALVRDGLSAGTLKPSYVCFPAD